MRLAPAFLITGLLVGCKAISQNSLSVEHPPSLADIKQALDDGQFYRARQMAKQLLDQKPQDPELEKIMADILDQEIAREKTILGKPVREELMPQEKTSATNLWLERAKSFFEMRQYDQAILAAERVFLYDPDNIEASRLIDAIRKKAMAEGKADQLYLKQSHQTEIRERVIRYRRQAREWMKRGRWGAARLAIEKVLLLMPEDKEALELYEIIQKRRKGSTEDEARKAL